MKNNTEKGVDLSLRQFIKSLGYIAGGSALLASTPWLTSCTPEKLKEISSEKARVAVIGTGSRGQYHLHNLKEIPHAQVVAICDNYPPNLKAAQELFPNAKTYTDYKKLLDEEQMRSYKLNQLRVNNQTKLNDLAMKIKVSAMQLNRKKVELRNEQYLDSLGSGTTDKVRQAELSYNVAQLEYEQLEQQYDNEKEVLAAEYKVQELDFSIFRKGLAEMKRTLDDAQIRSPRKAILTYINNQIGAQVSQGSQLAVISDLSHFKVEGEIADTYGDRVAAGGKAIVKIGSEKLEGTVSSVTPLSKNGVISFTVQLNEDNNRRLRSGLKTDVYVMNAVKEDVMRIANASYYVGRGEYELFVRNSDKEIVKRKVQLGDSNFEFVEVASGLQPGDQVVVSDMSNYKNKNKLKLN